MTHAMKIVDHPSPGQRACVWLFAVVVASLLPFVSVFLRGLDRDGIPSFPELVGRGDLLVIAIIITIGGVAELLLVMGKMPQRRSVGGIFLVLGAVLLVAGEAFWYADIGATLLTQPKLAQENIVAFGSTGLFVASAFCGVTCVYISAGVR